MDNCRFLNAQHRVVKPQLSAGSRCLLDLLQLQGSKEEQVRNIAPHLQFFWVAFAIFSSYHSIHLLMPNNHYYHILASRLWFTTALWIKGGWKELLCVKVSR